VIGRSHSVFGGLDDVFDGFENVLKGRFCPRNGRRPLVEFEQVGFFLHGTLPKE